MLTNLNFIQVLLLIRKIKRLTFKIKKKQDHDPNIYYSSLSISSSHLILF
jgi:hypothetical protein